jgi:hypothetical protein
MFYPVLKLIAWRFKKKKYEHFSQDQKTTASVISNEESQCILPWSSKNKQSQGFMIKRKELSPTSLLNTTYWRVWSSLLQRKDLHSSIIEIEYNDYCPGTMNIYFIWDRLEQKRLSGVPWHGMVLHKMLNIDCLCNTCQIFQMTKKDPKLKKYRLLPTKIAESDATSLGHCRCGDPVGPIYVQ